MGGGGFISCGGVCAVATRNRGGNRFRRDLIMDVSRVKRTTESLRSVTGRSG